MYLYIYISLYIHYIYIYIYVWVGNTLHLALPPFCSVPWMLDILANGVCTSLYCSALSSCGFVESLLNCFSGNGGRLQPLFQNTFKGSQLDSSKPYTLTDSKSSFMWKAFSGNGCKKHFIVYVADVFIRRQQYEKKTSEFSFAMCGTILSLR